MDNMGLAHHTGRLAIQNLAAQLRSQYAQMQQQAESIKRENAVIRHDNAMLRAQVDDLQNGYEALSELARSELGYIEEGETYYNLKRE